MFPVSPNEVLFLGFHAHVYFDADTRGIAEQIRETLVRLFGVKAGTMHDTPVGPHPRPMFEVDLAPEQFASIVPWLMIHRSGLSVFVHPITHDPVADHDTRPLWMGQSFPIDVELVRRHVSARTRARVGEVESREAASARAARGAVTQATEVSSREKGEMKQ
jgi:DOPA 4,5-dioxygenase